MDGRFLRKLAVRVWPDDDSLSLLKRELAQRLGNLRGGGEAGCVLPELSCFGRSAAHAVPGMPSEPREVEQLLQGDSCFSVSATRDGDAIISLDAAELKRRARLTTATGVLMEDLPPEGLVAASRHSGVHPIRPTQPACKFCLLNGTCAFRARCVYNHPPEAYKPRGGKARAANSQQQQHLRGQHQQPLPAGRPGRGASPAAAQTQHSAMPPAPAPALAPAPAPATPPPSGPGKAKCLMLLLRGFCAAGPSCTYDHSVVPGRVASGASSAGGAAPAPAGEGAEAAARAAAPQALLPPPPPPQQQQQQQPSCQEPRLVHVKGGQKGPFALRTTLQFPKAGVNSEGLPLRPGAASCFHYLHTRTCSFGAACAFHHPSNPPQPLRFFEKGFPPGRWKPSTPLPYARLVMHVRRIWDYSSCPEAQLKAWLARHLLAAGNPGLSMWSPSAAEPAAEDDWEPPAQGSGGGGGGSGGSPHSQGPAGRYSCSMDEAGAVLERLWSEQPGEAAQQRMPFAGKLHLLVQTDPWFQVLSDPGGGGGQCVRLCVSRMRDVLLW